MSTTKTAKPSVAVTDASSSRRSQPVRQTRTNPPRMTGGPSRTYTRDSIASVVGAATDQPIDIFPAVTHFVDAISALPRELVKHFTLLKEVDAKVHLPEQNLFQLIDAALTTPIPDLARSSADESSSSIPPASAPMSTQNSSTGLAVDGQPPPPPVAPSTDESLSAGVFDPSNLPRRQLFRQVAIEIKEMLVSLEEKNHVISTANDALHKQLARIDDVWPHLENEFSDEAKWGSTTHWAYPENRAGRSNNAQAERSRREGAASLSAAAQQIAEEAAARSDARKQAVALKKSLKNQHHHESDFDDHDTKQKGEAPSNKKTGGGKSRKAPTADSPATVGLGISNTATVNGANPAPKRRKVEKTTNGGAPMERAMSSVFGVNAGKPKATSPRETPVPEGGAAAKKRKALPTGGGNQAKKSRNGPGMSPSVTSSPVIGAFPDSTKPGRSSPAPPNTVRPAPARARQNSTQSNVETGKPRPTSSASNKPNGVSVVLPELAPPPNGVATTSTEKAKDVIVPVSAKAEAPKAEAAEPSMPAPAVVVGGIKEKASAKPDEAEAKPETPNSSAPITQTVTTKSGRASKPSTPALATFAEAARARPANAAAKRSHKKGASAAAAAQALAAQLADEDATSSKPEDEEEDPLYCYCNGVSYGEMIACDAEDCAKEWFHLECVGLKVAPKGNAKWFCEDCKKRLKVREGKTNGR